MIKKMTLKKSKNYNYQAYEMIKNAIIENEIAPGTAIVDLQLAEQFGISRMPVRDAIRKLEQEGIIVSNNKNRYFVFSPTITDINEIYEIRSMLEKEVVKQIWNKLQTDETGNYRNKLKELYNDIKLSETETGAKYIEADNKFHYNFIKLIDNKRLAKMYELIFNQIYIFRYYASHDSYRAKRSMKYHKVLIEKILSGEVDEAIKCLLKLTEKSRVDALHDLEKAEN